MMGLLSQKRILTVLVLAVFLAIWALVLGAATSADAEIIRHGTSGDLFYNYYAPPVGPCGVGAEMFPCPRPTPPLVGHTYITYQPLMPNEFLYWHHRTYITAHDDAPPTVTRVRWW
jgi:hypothetical protein